MVYIVLPPFVNEFNPRLALEKESPEEEKLEVIPTPADATLNEKLGAATLAAIRVFSFMDDEDTPDFVKLFVVNSAFALNAYGLIGTRMDPSSSDKRIKSGNYVEKETLEYDLSEERALEVVEMISPESVKKAITVLLATKVSWWHTNRHDDNYVRKLVMSVYKQELTNKEMNTSKLEMLMVYVSMAGKWMSTHKGLDILGIETMSRFTSSFTACDHDFYTICVTKEFKSKCRLSLPAGTEPHGITCETLEKYKDSKVWTLVPPARLQQLVGCFREVKSLLKLTEGVHRKNLITMREQRQIDPRVRYHYNSEFLCGQSKMTFQSPDCVGITGSVLFNFYRRSTLVRSPLIIRHPKNKSSAVDKMYLKCHTAEESLDRNLERISWLKNWAGVFGLCGKEVYLKFAREIGFEGGGKLYDTLVDEVQSKKGKKSVV